MIPIKNCIGSPFSLNLITHSDVSYIELEYRGIRSNLKKGNVITGSRVPECEPAKKNGDFSAKKSGFFFLGGGGKVRRFIGIVKIE